jgi:hypothetical protein
MYFTSQGTFKMATPSDEDIWHDVVIPSVLVSRCVRMYGCLFVTWGLYKYTSFLYSLFPA